MAVVLIGSIAFFTVATRDVAAQESCSNLQYQLSVLRSSGGAGSEWDFFIQRRMQELGCFGGQGQTTSRCPAGTEYCPRFNLCCGSGNYCSVYGCIQRGSIECGGYSCSPGNQCSRGGGCIPEGAVDCGSGSYCQEGSVCWTANGDIPGVVKRGEKKCTTAENARLLDERIAEIDQQKRREREAAETRVRWQKLAEKQQREAALKLKQEEKRRAEEEKRDAIRRKEEARKAEIERKKAEAIEAQQRAERARVEALEAKRKAEAEARASVAKVAAEKAAAAKLTAERAAAEKAAALKAAADKAAADRLAAQAAADKAAAEKLAAKAAADRAAAEKIAAARSAAEKAAADKAAVDKAAADRIAAAKAAAEKAAADKAAAAKAVADKAAADRIAAARAAAEKAAAEKIAQKPITVIAPGTSTTLTSQASARQQLWPRMGVPSMTSPLPVNKEKLKYDWVSLQLANAAYSDKLTLGSTVFKNNPDWKVLDRRDDKATGFTAFTFVNIKEHRMVVAVRGSASPTCLVLATVCPADKVRDAAADWIGNADAMVRGNISPQFRNAEQYVGDIKRRFGDRFAIDCSGHSQGGGACAYAASQTTGVHAVTINPTSANSLSTDNAYMIDNYVVGGEVALGGRQFMDKGLTGWAYNVETPPQQGSLITSNANSTVQTADPLGGNPIARHSAGGVIDVLGKEIGLSPLELAQ
ncbi:hypothetical protein [Undibacter mobilis]|uniref:hypothetical protein n=1 Tax=Undibacter mobilis TaxID=2292256 RepID=UPI001AECA9FE|nr:hypothetical protein [Undibacter mobilis]